MNPEDKPPVVPFLEYHGADCSRIYPDRAGYQATKCPFHDDKTASAGVNTRTQRFNCLANLGCPHGDVFDMIHQLYGTGENNFPAARNWLAAHNVEAGRPPAKLAGAVKPFESPFGERPPAPSCEVCGSELTPSGECEYGCT